MMEFICKYNSPIGELTLESDGKNLTGLWFENQQHYGNGLLKNYTEKKQNGVDIPNADCYNNRAKQRRQKHPPHLQRTAKRSTQ